MRPARRLRPGSVVVNPMEPDVRLRVTRRLSSVPLPIVRFTGDGVTLDMLMGRRPWDRRLVEVEREDGTRYETIVSTLRRS